MKKIYAGFMTGAFAAVLAIQAVAAGLSSVTVKSDEASVSYTYSENSGEEAVFDAEKLFSKRNEASIETAITDTFVITSNVNDIEEIELMLRLSVEPVSNAWIYSPLDYYSFVISDSTGKIVYNSADAKLSDADAVEKDIPLGVFNSSSANDEKTYTVEYKISENGIKNLSPEDVSKLSFSLVSRKSEKTVTATAAPAVPTAQPKFELTSPNTPAEPTAQPTPQATAAPTELVAEKKEKKLVCGTDIDAGRYVVKGNGIVKVESETGELESQATINDGSVEGVEGEASAIITLSKGDVLTLLPLDGQEKATVALEKTNSGSSASTASRNNGTTSASGKTNPKTGEGSTAVLFVVMILAAAGIAAVEVLKRKRVK